MSLTARALTFRWPGFVGVVVFLALVYAGGAATAMGVLSGGVFDAATVRGAAWPAAVATMLTGLLIGPPVRRLELRATGAVLARCALAWGTVGAVWPVANALSDAITGGAPGSALSILTLIPLGAVIGALSGLAGGGLATAAALRRG